MVTPTFDDGEDVKERLGKMCFCDLLSLNPTLEELRDIILVLSIGHGKTARDTQGNIKEVRRILGEAKR